MSHAPQHHVTVKTLDQLRAEYSWKRVNEVPQGSSKDYTNIVKKLPAQIATNGLGQALAFLAYKAGRSKDGRVDDQKPHGRAFHDVVDWLTRRIEGVYQGPYEGQGADGLTALVGADSQNYLRARAEALAVLGYLRLFAATRGKA